VTKNKVAAPFRQAEFDIMYNEGISRVGDILDIGVEMGVIDKRGSFYNYGDERLAQGRENAKGFLAENLDIAGEIEAKIRSEFGLAPAPGSKNSDNGRRDASIEETEESEAVLELEDEETEEELEAVLELDE
jgi:recombination protein RecA